MTPAKRLLDVVGAVTGIILLGPLLLVLAVLVRLEDGGPVFYRQERVGFRGKPFRIWKYRSMVTDADRRAGPLTVGRDPRVTRTGYWLRKFKLDELPQLFNVLVGEMSFVGPRPEVPRYVAHYTPDQRRILDYVPGITDVASLAYRNESELLGRAPDPEAFYLSTVMPDKIRLDLEYAARATVRTDLRLIALTALQVFLRPAAGAKSRLPLIAMLTGFAVLFWPALADLMQQWWTDPEASHGLLLVPVIGYLAWRHGIVARPVPGPATGLVFIAAAAVLRWGAELASSMIVMRVALLLAVVGMVVFTWGGRQVLHWWLPAVLLVLSIPLPAVVLNTLALPLQLKASQLGAALLAARHVPVALAGNVIHLPDRTLFVTEACSGLRSLTALLALAVLVGGIWLRSTWSRAALVVLAMPIAVLINGVRVFLTGFLVHYVNPRFADGFLHYSEGLVLFLGALVFITLIAWALGAMERVPRQEAALA